MSLIREVLADLRAPLERDPAATNLLEVLLAYPGVHAVVAHRFIHRLAHLGIPLLPRLLSTAVRHLTGIEIHPEARIGAGLFIDHGMGVVIGATAIVGEGVTLYQGVTLGGRSLTAEKRHPTLGDRVRVGVGASVLGAISIGDDAQIGAGAVVVNDVAPQTTVIGIPARPIEASVDTRIAAIEARLAHLEATVATSPLPLSDQRNGR